jgi:RNA recognition motif-containing protein
MTTLVATNISPETSKDEITTFFAFCGKIKNIDITEGETLTATITYEESKAYRTALLLNNSQFGPNRITITPAGGAPAADYDSDDGTHAPSGQASETGEISQENKPRSRIVAEYLAHGYVIGDAAVTRALELDEKHGVSARFFNTLQSLDQKYNASSVCYSQRPNRNFRLCSRDRILCRRLI